MVWATAAGLLIGAALGALIGKLVVYLRSHHQESVGLDEFLALGLFGAPISRDQRWLISWFGIRGIGSIYYLMYAINHRLPEALATQIIAITLTTVTVSIILHGVSVTPLMELYARRKARRTRR